VIYRSGNPSGGYVFDSMYAQWGGMLAPYVWPAALVAVVSLPLWIVPTMWIGSRRFNRRNIAGVEEFGSYGSAVGSRLVESLVNVVGALFVTVFLGAFIIALAGFIFGRY